MNGNASLAGLLPAFIHHFAGMASGEREFCLQNPVVRAGADPWILFHRGWYYFTCTSADRIEIRKARTLQELSDSEPFVIWTAPACGPCARDIWAPEFHWVGDRWFLYFTGTTRDGSDANRRVFVMRSRSENLLGGWEPPIQLSWKGEDHYAIDGTLFPSREGFLFLWSGREESHHGPQNLYLAPMENPWRLSGPRIQISTPEHAWEKCGWSVNEGPHVLQRNGRTFIVYSASAFVTDDYCLGMLSHQGGSFLESSRWVKHSKPVFQSYCGPFGKVFGPGHHCCFRSPDGTQDWIGYHAQDARRSPPEARSARVQPFRWHPDGTPDFGQPIPSKIPVPEPASHGATAEVLAF